MKTRYQILTFIISTVLLVSILFLRFYFLFAYFNNWGFDKIPPYAPYIFCFYTNSAILLIVSYIFLLILRKKLFHSIYYFIVHINSVLMLITSFHYDLQLIWVILVVSILSLATFIFSILFYLKGPKNV